MVMQSAKSIKWEILQDKQPDFSTRKGKEKKAEVTYRLKETSNINHTQHVDGLCLTHDSNQSTIKKENHTI